MSAHNRLFSDDRPTSSPYITAVGGSTGSPEVAWQYGGGGFSNTYGMPSYQAAAVNTYLTSGVAPAAKYFNASGRAYPDVAAFATNFEIVMNGMTLAVDGTSCAAPTFAGVVAALNDVRMAAGKSTLGFLNPLLYKLGASNSDAFNDIGECVGMNMGGLCWVGGLRPTDPVGFLALIQSLARTRTALALGSRPPRAG